MQQKTELIYRQIENSPFYVVYCGDGSIVASYIFLSGSDKSGYNFVFEFYPEKIWGFAATLSQVHQEIVFYWMLFTMSNKI